MISSGLRVIAATLVLVAAPLAIGAGTIQIPARQSADPSLPPPPITRMVNIDGRFVTVSLSVTTVIPGIIPENWEGPSTGVSVAVSIQDGAPLPAGLTAARVRFERLYGTNRVFFSRLTQLEDTPTEQFELDRDDYSSDITGRFGAARRLKATVRLEVDGRVIPVSMGTIRINTLALP